MGKASMAVKHCIDMPRIQSGSHKVRSHAHPKTNKERKKEKCRKKPGNFRDDFLTKKFVVSTVGQDVDIVLIVTVIFYVVVSACMVAATMPQK